MSTSSISQKQRVYGLPCVLVLFSMILLQSLCARQNQAWDSIHTRLISIPAHSQHYYVSKGQQQRADSIISFIEKAVHFFRQEVGFAPKAALYILAPEDWKGVAAKPLQQVYGFPHNIDSARLAVAAEDNDFWKSFLPDVKQLPDPLAAQVYDAYGRSDGSFSMMPFFDLLALHEFGHSYTAQAGLNMHRYWMGELFVNIMLHTFVAEVEPWRLPALTTFPNMVIAACTREFRFTSLEDFEKLYPTLGMGPKNYGWYQCRLHAAAKDIYNLAGKSVLRKLWNALKKYQTPMSDEAFVEMLGREVNPSVAAVILNWD